MRRPNHDSRIEGIAKNLQSQVTEAARKRLSLSGLEVLHGRRIGHGILAMVCVAFPPLDPNMLFVHESQLYTGSHTKAE
jgi:hypothetical protein